MDYKNGLKECSGCGFSLPKDASICPYCGTRFIDDGAEEKKTQTEYSKIQNTSKAEKMKNGFKNGLINLNHHVLFF